ncbi:MAG: GatB/YqeY domain-containing protein [Ignavibacteriales bacterium]|mgnify:CR=1 FL=1|nr:MAG: GatB/YqeY domain-containing protein [Ignavibacteriaceae bacterium]MBW7872369.1 GatB/YqeY domain-containing protein [Ignavibacteria bacterium]MCZ2142652.1 GatB/YqeY domain-containing protein [Ignavibacteriales bacterium]OQY76069.1 MAG: glutamyl-tRNA amidotransferase [Ignavibacteriales bacterium UTCHB3]MBV6445485.1 putative protein YqeY [Ignavibacteriaceae bacterium]
MSLKERISEELKSAMKQGDQIRLQTIRSIKAAVLEYEKSGKGELKEEAEEINLLNSLAKRRKESMEIYRAAGRNELADKEEKELAVINEYLPKPLSEAEVAAKIASIAEANNIPRGGEFGKLMPLVMKELKGKADGALVKGLTEAYLKS